MFRKGLQTPSSQVPLADAAIASGFSDQAHLTRWYKRIYGVTPGKYAAACNNVQYT